MLEDVPFLNFLIEFASDVSSYLFAKRFNRSIWGSAWGEQARKIPIRSRMNY